MKKNYVVSIISVLSYLWLIVLQLLQPVNCFAQSGGAAINITGTSADQSAMLDVSSTTTGVLIPRMTTTQRNAISSPAEGLQIYNTTMKCFEFYANGFWQVSGCAYTFSCGNTLTDPRDGQVYNTVQIGTQCWMAKNINFGAYVTASIGQGGTGVQKYCYNDNVANCNTYGGLYEWAEVMQGATSCNGTGSSQPACTNPVQGICPPYWHVPSHYEITLLEKSVGSNPGAFPYDVTTTGWLGVNEGTNLKAGGSSGFNGLFAGYSYSGAFYLSSTTGRFWSSTEYSVGAAWSRYLESAPATVYRYYDGKVAGFSVRCLKD